MEGRAIARPNAFGGASDNPGYDRFHVPSMEGRAIARPNSARDATPVLSICLSPSMEGRAIARPNGGRSFRSMGTRCCTTFNGGPGNCPAKHRGVWASVGRGVRHGASMEGRAIARPNDGGRIRIRPAEPPSRFNGGPGNCPAKPRRVHVHDHPPPRTMLQWRAGQLPGQTWSARTTMLMPVHSRESLQWRAGQLPGQTRL